MRRVDMGKLGLSKPLIHFLTRRTFMKNPMAPQLLSSDHMKKLLFGSLMSLALAACTTEKTTQVTMPSPGQNTLETTTVRESSDGTVNGGGGKGVLCNKNGKTTVELLDLYEARTLFGLEIAPFAETGIAAQHKLADLLSSQQWGTGIDLDDQSRDWMRSYFVEFFKKTKFIESDKKLKPTHDSLDALLETGCESVQIATFYDETILLIDKGLWDKMDSTNQAALLAHEFLYLYERRLGNTNSVRTRKYVGQLFSTQGAKPKFDASSRREAQCWMDDSLGNSPGVYAYEVKPNEKDSDEKVEIMFASLPKVGALFRTSAEFYISLDQLTSPSESFAMGPDLADVKQDSYVYSPIQLQLALANDDQRTDQPYVLRVFDSATNQLLETYKLGCALVEKSKEP